MANDSTTLGFVPPVSADPYDDPLDDLLQAAVVGICGLPGKYVRPRWQPKPPNQPAFDVDWVAFGVTRSSVDTFAFANHSADDPEQSSVDRDELLFVLHSFYGPNSGGLCERFRDGLELSQNRDVLSANRIEIVEVGEATRVPALLQETWVRRVDAMVTYRRRTSRRYQIKSLVQGQLGLDNEHYVTPIIVTNQ